MNAIEKDCGLSTLGRTAENRGSRRAGVWRRVLLPAGLNGRRTLRMARQADVMALLAENQLEHSGRLSGWRTAMPPGRSWPGG